MNNDNRNLWVTPRLEFKGAVGDVLKGGGGKLSVTSSDPGENRCEKGQDGQHCATPNRPN